MPASKLWLVLLTLLATLLAAFVVVQPTLAQREIDWQLAARLGASQISADSLLRLQARKWIDAVTRGAADVVLAEALEQAPRGGPTLALVHQTALERLHQFNREWNAALVLAVDARGHVLARSGLDETTWSDDLSNAPLVGEALRGFALDDLWNVNGKLLRVCAAPVMAREQYVGALLVGTELNSELAASLKAQLDVEVFFLAGGQLVGQSASLPYVADLPKFAQTHAKDLANARSSGVIAVTVGSKTYNVIFAPLKGAAAQSGALYALAGERARIASPLVLLRRIALKDLPPWPLGSIALAGLLALLVGMGLIWREQTRPMARLKKELQAIAQGQSAKVNSRGFNSGFLKLANEANAAIESQRQAAQPSINETAPAPLDLPEESPPSEPFSFAPSTTPLSPLDLSNTSSPNVVITDNTSQSAIIEEQPVVHGGRTFVGPPPAPDSDEEFRSIFQEFIDTKRTCGESTDKVSYERFAQRLRDNRAQLLARYPGRGVKFEVYVKEGKAAIKAIPVGHSPAR